MTSNDVPPSAPGGAAGRRRALGRGPGSPPPFADPDPAPPAPAPHPPPPISPPPEPDAADPDTADSDTADPDAGRPETTGPDVPGASAPSPAAAAQDARAPDAAAPDARRPAAEGPAVARPHARRRDETGSGAPGTALRGSGAAQPPFAEPDALEPDALEPDALEPDALEPDALEPDEAGRSPVDAGAGTVAEEDGSSSRDAADGVFTVRLANFEGPFDLLLQLISKHKLDVTEVALSKVTDEFMAHIRAMGSDWDLDQTTEFLVVAATLLDLKAARLLPAAEVEDEADLALLEARDLLFARLLQYRAYKRIADIFTDRLESEGRRYPRTVGLEAHHAELLPEVVISIGAEGFARLAVKAMQPRAKPQVYVDHIHAPLVSVQEQAGIVVARLRELGEASFRALVEDTDDTLTVVARFLALLELYREKAVALDQETALGELVVRWTGGDGNAGPRVTDEFDRPPEDAGKETRT
ncbi:segregation/condensation protein A [Streptomyces sp. NPDC021608]|uniref:segregation and condensation protein A n=1 Tax=Streptomyces sp. NPDC021608 TaxID=3154903 RepID=UPI0033DA7AE8